MTALAQIEASAAALARETIPLGDWQPLLPERHWACECGAKFCLPEDDAGLLLVCDECERCWVSGEQSVRRVKFETSDPERLAGILVLPTDEPDILELSKLVVGLDPEAGRLYYRSATPSDLRPLIAMLWSLGICPDEGDGVVRWVGDVGRERNELLRLLPAAFKLVDHEEAEVLDGHGLDIGVSEERVWASEGDRAWFSVYDEERIGSWITLKVFVDRVAYRRDLASK